MYAHFCFQLNQLHIGPLIMISDLWYRTWAIYLFNILRRPATFYNVAVLIYFIPTRIYYTPLPFSTHTPGQLNPFNSLLMSIAPHTSTCRLRRLKHTQNHTKCQYVQLVLGFSQFREMHISQKSFRRWKNLKRSKSSEMPRKVSLEKCIRILYIHA